MGKQYLGYIKKFNGIVRNKVYVIGTKFDQEVSELILDAAEYRQCYKKGSKVREQLPKYWFVSKEGFLISVKGAEPRWIKPNLTSGRPQFKISYKGKQYPITTYDLVGLVWDSYVSPDAAVSLEKYGLKVIGRNIKIRSRGKKNEQQHVLKVQGHHKNNGYIHKNDLKSYISNNDPEKLQFLTNREHVILHSLSGDWNEDKGKFFRGDMLNVLDESPKAYLPGEGVMLPLENLEVEKVLNIHVEPEEKDCFKTKEYTFVSEDNRAMLEKHIDILVDAAASYKNISPDMRLNQIDLFGTIVFFSKNN